MKRSLFSPLNIILLALIAGAVWYYMKHMHKADAHPEVMEHIAAITEEKAVSHEAPAHTEHAEVHHEEAK